LNSNANSYSNIVIMGDININALDLDDARTVEYLTALAENNLLNLITTPTRIEPRASTTIDHIITNFNLNSIVKYGVIYTDISDHFSIFSLIKWKNNYCKQEKFNKKVVLKEIIDEKNIKNVVRNANWKNVMSKTDATTAYNNFLEKIITAKTESTTVKKIPQKRNFYAFPKKPYVTAGLLKSIKIRDKLHKQFKNNPVNNDLKEKYTTYRNKVTDLLRKAKDNYYQHKFENCEGDIRETYKIIDSILNPNKKCDNEIKLIHRENIIDSPQQISDLFNQYFLSIVQTNEKTNRNCNSEALDIISVNSSMYLKPVTEHEVIRVIENLKSKSSSGWDGISMKLIKKIKFEIAEPLTYIINLIFKTSVFPDKLKIAKVIPIHKKGVKTQVSNYRPISLLPSFSKVIEKLILNQLENFQDQHKFLHNHQFGFRKGLSTALATVSITNNLQNSLDKKQIAVLFSLDLSKAFDMINHSLLLKKPYLYGYRGPVFELIKSYLSNRYQYTQVENVKSFTGEITRGVPQGAILSPYLFLLFINDMNTAVNEGLVYQYADDTNFIISHSSLDLAVKKTQDQINKIKQWLDTNKLEINVSKSLYDH
jgi:hypothetical protein